METSFTIQFDPEATAPDPSPDPSPPAMTLTFAVDLRGVGMHSTVPGLSAQLTIPFSLADLWARLCERATFTGISPMGHAPLVLNSASYLGSSCAYGDPSTWDPLVVYLDDPGSSQVLTIGFPTENLWSFFQWPSGIVNFSPALTDQEQRPPLWFDVDDFVDVQIPMRLQFEIPPDPLDPKPTTVVLRELTYEDAPTVTASAYRVTCTSADVPIQLTGPEIAAALTAAGYEEGVYDLIWKIYRGAGDMIYRARCIESDLGTYTDRIVGFGGGPGIELDTDLLVARVEAAYTPGPFYVSSSLGTHSVRTDASYRAMTLLAGQRACLVAIDAAPLALSWTGNAVYLSGRLVYAYPQIVLCVGMRATGGVRHLVALCGDANGHFVYTWPLIPSGSPTLVATHPAPSLAVGLSTPMVPATTAFQMSADTTRAICYAGHRSNNEAACGGVVWILDGVETEGAAWSVWRSWEGEDGLAAAVTGSAQWATIDPTLMPSTCLYCSYPYDDCMLEEELSVVNTPPPHDVTASIVSVFDAGWDGDSPVVYWAKITLAAQASYSYSLITTPYGPICRIYGANVAVNLSAAGNYQRTISIYRNEAVQWSGSLASNEYSINATPWLDEPVGGDATWGGELVISWEKSFNDVRVSAQGQNALLCFASLGQYAWSWHETQNMAPAAWNECGNGSKSFKATIANLGDQKTLISHAWLNVNGERFDHSGARTDFAYEKVNLSDHDWSLIYPDSFIDENESYGPDGVKAHLRESLTAVFATSGYLARGAQAPDQTIAAHLYVDDVPITRVGGVTVGNEPEEDLYANATISSIRLATPYPCLIGPDPSATLPSGNPAIPPAYADLLDAINAARVAASVPALAVDSGLVVAAAIHCQWMLDESDLTEIGINDSTPLDRARLSGYRGATVGEIRGATSAIFAPPIDSLISDWQADPVASAVLLDPNWTRVGGYILPWSSTGSIACVDFGIEAPVS